MYGFFPLGVEFLFVVGKSTVIEEWAVAAQSVDDPALLAAALLTVRLLFISQFFSLPQSSGFVLFDFLLCTLVETSPGPINLEINLHQAHL